MPPSPIPSTATSAVPSSTPRPAGGRSDGRPAARSRSLDRESVRQTCDAVTGGSAGWSGHAMDQFLLRRRTRCCGRGDAARPHTSSGTARTSGRTSRRRLPVPVVTRGDRWCLAMCFGYHLPKLRLARWCHDRRADCADRPACPSVSSRTWSMRKGTSRRQSPSRGRPGLGLRFAKRPAGEQPCTGGRRGNGRGGHGHLRLTHSIRSQRRHGGWGRPGRRQQPGGAGPDEQGGNYHDQEPWHPGIPHLDASSLRVGRRGRSSRSVRSAGCMLTVAGPWWRIRPPA